MLIQVFTMSLANLPGRDHSQSVYSTWKKKKKTIYQTGLAESMKAVKVLPLPFMLAGFMGCWENNRIVKVWKDLQDHLVQPSAHPHHAHWPRTQCHIHTALEHLQQQWLRHFPVQPIPLRVTALPPLSCLTRCVLLHKYCWQPRQTSLYSCPFPAVWAACATLSDVRKMHDFPCSSYASAPEVVWRPRRQIPYANYVLCNARGVQIKHSKAALYGVQTLWGAGLPHGRAAGQLSAALGHSAACRSSQAQIRERRHLCLWIASFLPVSSLHAESSLHDNETEPCLRMQLQPTPRLLPEYSFDSMPALS